MIGRLPYPGTASAALARLRGRCNQLLDNSTRTAFQRFCPDSLTFLFSFTNSNHLKFVDTLCYRGDSLCTNRKGSSGEPAGGVKRALALQGANAGPPRHYQAAS